MEDERRARRTPDDERIVRRAADDEARRPRRSVGDDEPRRSSRAPDDEQPWRNRGAGTAEAPRRSRRALEAQDQETDDAAQLVDRLADDVLGPGRRRRRADVDEPRRRTPDFGDMAGDQPGRRAAGEEPRRLRRVDDLTGEAEAPPRSWRAAEGEPRRLRSVDDDPLFGDPVRPMVDLGTQPRRSRRAAEDAAPEPPPPTVGAELVSWRDRELPPSPSRNDTYGQGVEPEAPTFGSTRRGAHAALGDSSALDTWKSETGTWRTSDTTATGSWQKPTSFDAGGTDTGAWRTRTTPETGSWSRSRGEFVPNDGDAGEQPNFAVRRFDETGEIPRDMLPAGRGRVLDHDDFYEAGRTRADRRDRDDDRRDDDGRPPRRRRPVEDDIDDERPRRRPNRALAGGRRDDEDDDFRERPRERARTRPATRESVSGRHSSRMYDEDERRPASGSTRRGAGSRYSEAGRGVVRYDRTMVVPISTRPAFDDEDEDDEDDTAEDATRAYARAGFASVAWFSGPLAAFLLWAVFFAGPARADCVDAAGRPCPAPRETALATFMDHLPQVGVAVVLSVIVALLIRLMAPLWRPATIGFAASVVGAGVTTVLFTVLNSST